MFVTWWLRAGFGVSLVADFRASIQVCVCAHVSLCVYVCVQVVVTTVCERPLLENSVLDITGTAGARETVQGATGASLSESLTAPHSYENALLRDRVKHLTGDLEAQRQVIQVL
jgi:hypothetical protein